MKKIMALALALLLAACSGEPGEGDIREAVFKNAAFRMSLGMMVGGVAAMETTMKSGSIEKSSCVSAQGAPGYVCDFRIGFKQPNGSVMFGTPLQGRFFKSGGNWDVELSNQRR